jgi:hypothetical protein
MSPTVRIDDEVYAWLQNQARPFEDTPNSVLRRIAGLDKSADAKEVGTVPTATKSQRGAKTPQSAYRSRILKILLQHGGQASRTEVLNEVERTMARQLTPIDRAKIESGTIRWQKSAEWEVRAMREARLLKPVVETPTGVWALTKKGEDAAQDL